MLVNVIRQGSLIHPLVITSCYQEYMYVTVGRTMSQQSVLNVCGKSRVWNVITTFPNVLSINEDIHIII